MSLNVNKKAAQFEFLNMFPVHYTTTAQRQTEIMFLMFLAQHSRGQHFPGGPV